MVAAALDDWQGRWEQWHGDERAECPNVNACLDGFIGGWQEAEAATVEAIAAWFEKHGKWITAGMVRRGDWKQP